MIRIYEMNKYLKENLIENRYNHTVGVVNTAIELAEIHGENKFKAEIAALSHDIAKNMKVTDLKKLIDEEGISLTIDEEKNMELWHAIVAPILGKKVFKIEDDEILSAMRWHTTGKENMSRLDKIIYLADLIEPSRKFNGIDELRKVAKEDLDLAMVKALTHTIKYLLDRNLAIDGNTFKARNYLLYNNVKL
ncbi:bis(5'-nucleosyl)-tetraphosphatase (symmetrical) YqeK [Clostridium sp. NSJ-6]|uniref:bis(5'-nucleosyl)-tetraphosphatase (symmetrical) n=1 Tax=Clostridium hominis TaxID=2763036 RepID=A0ABR7DGM8_9CLOT|nr:bis(5'-nucleosyl)-tetraphosphatase (symmetrical) YqeK [Clostridium hominis]MBC5629828.1 bis(5'-nucleosyl)-tetraphosphatase (symmetrical) YqeK [Clostridium hominis]